MEREREKTREKRETKIEMARERIAKHGIAADEKI